MDRLEHMSAILALTYEAMERKSPEDCEEGCTAKLKQQLLKTKAEMAFSEDDPHLQKEVAVLHGKEMP